MAGTIVERWKRATSEDPGVPAFLVRENGSWREIGWRRAGERVDELAAGFLALGIRKGDRVGLLGRTRLEWALCDYAVASIGAVIVAVYQTSSRRECAYLLADSGARVLVCEDAEQLAKTAGLEQELPALEQRIAFEGAGPTDLSLDALASRGRAYLAEHPGALEEASAAVSGDDVLTFIYTSGTTGDPKGCVITHANFVAVVDAVRETGVFQPGDTALLFLPLAHNFGRLVHYCGAGIPLTIAFCPEAADIARALQQVRPTIFPSVPRLFEKAYTAVQGKLERAQGLERRVAGWALGVGRRASARRQAGRRLSPLLAFEHRVADRLLFAKVKERFGGRLRLAVSGGAPLSREIIEFFAACDILILEGYGLSETTSGCTMNRPDAHRFGTVGPPLPAVELDIAEDGEIKVRGPSLFQGYHGRPDATAEAVTSDGWLLTGDVGTVDRDGFLTITDRKKEIIVTAGGKKIPPQNLENALKASAYVSQALVVGDGRPFVVALLSPDPEETARSARTEEEVRELIGEVVDEVNSHLGSTEQIRRFAVLPREFSVEQGEITPTLKLRRKVCEAHFHEEIERLYAGRR